MIASKPVICAIALLLALPSAAMAQGKPVGDPMPRKSIATVSDEDQRIMGVSAFVQSHPDLLYMYEATEAYRAKNWKKAYRFFELAGLYGDKIAQAMVGEMLWEGQGVKRDRAKAYAMMDIAAERGNNESLLLIREKYWEQLSEPERQAAVAQGDAIVARFSDDNAKGRLQRAFRTDKLSRIRISPGLLQSLEITGADGAPETIRADRFYEARFWEPTQYLALRDELTLRILRNGKVKVRFGGAVNVDAPKPVQE